MRTESRLTRAARRPPARGRRNSGEERGNADAATSALRTRLARLGVEQPGDILFVLPLRYEDRTHVVPIGALVEGMHAVVEGEVLLSELVFRRRRQLLLRLADGTGSLTLRFFYFSNAQRQALARGSRLRCFGEVRRGPYGPELVHPEYRHITALSEPLPQTLTPIYPATEGVTQGRLRMLVDRAMRALDAQGVTELLPPALLERLRLPALRQALEFMHRPPVGIGLEQLTSGRHPAQRRLAFEELLAHHLSLLELRRRSQRAAALPLSDASGLEARLLASLPFQLTAAQRRVLAEVDRDLTLSEPMARLVQGDVGCGKTVIAAAAAARAIGSGAQAAFMAPTELLAEQHARTLMAWFEPLGVHVSLLTGSLNTRARRAALHAAATGAARLCVGTHALFQGEVAFDHLALAIIDEQHRFGVQQRLQLAAKGGRDRRRAPHQLIMSATPIPRTLAMTVYADLDVSIVDELPPGRTAIGTVVLPEERRAQVVQRIDAACRAGRQAYWVCPLISESEELQAQAAEETAQALAEALPAWRVELLHGRMAPKQKEQIMQCFVAGQTQLLVATTVIEVGVDVPNASLMVIENAERMGLAQLHQLRGRVGRGQHASNCVLLYHSPLSPMARARLATIRDSNDGFKIAHRDLELRGPGELLGRRQTGLAQLRVADLSRDADLLADVRAAAAQMIETAPDRVAALRLRWIGERERYGRVG
ncbi:MAG: ATP-dependent DNA helicase RecG [Steroidobacteraceae bacterium]